MNEYFLFVLADEMAIDIDGQLLSHLPEQETVAEFSRAQHLVAKASQHRRVWRIETVHDLSYWQKIATHLSDALATEVYCLKKRQFDVEAKLLISDMDSTMIQTEVIDELAKYAGAGEQVQAVTEQAMRGELDFNDSLKNRVALLKGLQVSSIEQVKNNLPLSRGAEQLLGWIRQRGAYSALVSGGFLPFVDALQSRLGFDHVKANHLVIDDKCLTGEVSGEIVNGQVKADFLTELLQHYNLKQSQSVAVGDGANDLLMMQAAGLSFAFYAKPIVNEQADVAIRFGGLERICYHFE